MWCVWHNVDRLAPRLQLPVRRFLGADGPNLSEMPLSKVRPQGLLLLGLVLHI